MLGPELLADLGLHDLSENAQRFLLGQIYTTLEKRVGIRLAARMTDAQLDEFEAFVDLDDEAGALAWLEENFPDYASVTAGEFDDLKAEIVTNANEVRTLLEEEAETISLKLREARERDG